VDFLPFWLGGLALGGVAAWSWLIEGRTFGVTSEVSKIVDTIADPEFERQAKAFAQRDPADILAALAAATAAELGVAPAPIQPRSSPAKLDLQRHIPIAHRALFLLFIGLGAASASLLDGSFAVRWTLGEAHEAMVGTGWTAWAALFVGGIAVGFGTRMAGGCTSGHGLTGCARLLPRSFIATATFLATAILFTLVTEALL
jgi:uncharacterized protein